MVPSAEQINQGTSYASTPLRSPSGSRPTGAALLECCDGGQEALRRVP